jgi:hypothetical protein
MSLEISNETENLLNNEARRQGVSVDALVQQLMRDHNTAEFPAAIPELPVWHLGCLGDYRREDIYDDGD